MRRQFLAATGLAFLGGARARAQGEPICRRMQFEGDGFTVCRYAPATDELRLENLTGGRPIGGFAALKVALRKAAPRVRFAMNAGMYEEDRTPVGLFVADGRRLHPLNLASGGGNFFLKPNGVFWVDAKGAPRIDESAAFAASDVHPIWATQSGPLLLGAGQVHPAIMPNGTSLAIHNGVGVTDDEALFAISDGPVSFGRFARLFRDSLGCPDALYLDGSVSSAWIPALGRMDPRVDLGTFVVVLGRKSPPA